MSEMPIEPNFQDSETPPDETSTIPPSAQDRPGMPDANVCPNCGWPNSPSRVTCKKCRAPLPVVKRPELLALSTTTKWIHFASGFIGWFLVNGLVWWLIGLPSGDDYTEPIMGLIILPVNIIILIGLATMRNRRWIALGILAAWALNLLLSIIFGVGWNGACLLPFFIDFGM